MTEEKGTELAEQQRQHDIIGYEGSEAYQQQRAIIKASAPFAEKMTAIQIDYVARRSYALGVDPMNSHEGHWYLDKKNKVQFQWAYQLIEQFIAKFHGQHTMPKYRELETEELVARGLNPDDHAVEVVFFMNDDLPKVYEAAASGAFDVHEAREMFMMRGIGTATAKEWDTWYFAPAGRDKRWKIEKRAVTDALIKRFGTPNRAQVSQLRRDRGQDVIEAEDWQDTEGLAPGDAVALAKLHAQDRQRAPMSREDMCAAKEALFGAPKKHAGEQAPDEDVQDGEFTMTDEATPEPPPDPLDEHFPREDDEAASDTEPKPAPKLETKGDYFNAILAAVKEFHALTSLDLKRVPDGKWNIERARKALEIIVVANSSIMASQGLDEAVDFYDIHSEVGQALAQV